MPQPGGPTTLLELSLETISSNISRYSSLGLLPEDLAVVLFDAVLAKGKLTPQALKLFTDMEGHDLLLLRIKALNLRDPPPLIKDTRNGWLGDKPTLY